MRGRRRGYLLEHPAQRGKDRVQPLGGSMAPPPEFHKGVLEPTAGVWEGRGSPGTKMAGKIQCQGPRDMGRAHLREGNLVTLLGFKSNSISWNVGDSPFPVPPSGSARTAPARHDTFVAVDARMVYRDRLPGCSVDDRCSLESPPAVPARYRRSGCLSGASGSVWRKARPFPNNLRHCFSANANESPDGGFTFGATPGAPDRAAPPRTYAMASSRH